MIGKSARYHRHSSLRPRARQRPKSAFRQLTIQPVGGVIYQVLDPSRGHSYRLQKRRDALGSLGTSVGLPYWRQACSTCRRPCSPPPTRGSSDPEDETSPLHPTTP